MAERSRSFGPTVVAGLAGAALSAVAAAQDWARSSGEAAGVDVTATITGSQAAPLAVALGLVALAAWGVVMVLRGRARQVAAAIGVLASAGVLLTTVLAFGPAQDAAVEAVTAKGATGDAFSSTLTAWFYATALGALLTLVAFVVAVRSSMRWPTMGSRYDAPVASAARATRPAETEQDLWRALDDGRDPTA